MTRSPQINEVLEHARARAAGRTAPELMPALEQAEQMVTKMRMIFEAQLRFRERTALLKAQLPRIHAAFESLARALAALREGRFGIGADGLEQGFNALMEAMDALRAEEESWPTYSRSPYMNITMRLAHGAARGAIAPDALDQALAEMLAQHRRIGATIEASVRPGREASRFEERRAQIHGYLATIEHGLEEARRALAAGRVVSVPTILQPAVEATDGLVAVEDQFKNAEEAVRQRPCFRCGTTNPRTHRHCVKCGGMLPPMPFEEEDEAAIDVTLEEGQMRARGHLETELTHRLRQAVEQARHGVLTHEGFQQVLDEAAQRLQRARRDLERLPLPPDPPPEVVEAATAAAEAMRTALDEFDEGLGRMRAWLVDGNPATLEFGLDAVLTAGDKMAGFMALVQRPPT